jgi:hypothetical protein
VRRQPKLSWPLRPTADVSGMRKLQRSKIAEIRVALVGAGFCTLDAQAAALSLSRSTAWSLLNPSHKGSGRSAHLIGRMWHSPRLPRSVRQKLYEYVEQKLAGCYGHNDKRLREFAQCLMTTLGDEFAFVVEDTGQLDRGRRQWRQVSELGAAA